MGFFPSMADFMLGGAHAEAISLARQASAQLQATRYSCQLAALEQYASEHNGDRTSIIQLKRYRTLTNARGETFWQWNREFNARIDECGGVMSDEEKCAWGVDLREWEALRV